MDNGRGCDGERAQGGQGDGEEEWPVGQQHWERWGVGGHASAMFWAQLDLEEHWELLLRPGHGIRAWELPRFKSSLVLSNGMYSDSPNSVLKTLGGKSW